MIRVSESALISHPAAAVFAVASDPFLQLRWDPGTLKSVVQLTPGALGYGARYRGKFRGLGMVDYQFLEFEPGRRFTHRVLLRVGPRRHTFQFEPVPDGTVLTQQGELTPNFWGRVVGRLLTDRMRNRFRTIAAEISQYMASPPTELAPR